MLMPWSDDLGNVITRFTGRLVCLVRSICFLLFGRFCYFKLDFLFVFIPTVTKNIIPHTAEVALLYLLCWSAWQLIRGNQTIGPGLNERLLLAWDQATKPRSGALSLGKSSFFTLKCNKCDCWKVFRPFFLSQVKCVEFIFTWNLNINK